jgi:hypothetical protein
VTSRSSGQNCPMAAPYRGLAAEAFEGTITDLYLPKKK